MLTVLFLYRYCVICYYSIMANHFEYDLNVFDCVCVCVCVFGVLFDKELNGNEDSKLPLQFELSHLSKLLILH